MTSYTPEYIELVPNALDKYVVASYTPGLVTAEDGSITIYAQADQPKTNTANWLPVPKGHFSLLFRVYGPLARSRGRMCRPRFTAPSNTRSRVVRVLASGPSQTMRGGGYKVPTRFTATRAGARGGLESMPGGLFPGRVEAFPVQASCTRAIALG